MAPARELIAGAPSHYARARLLAEFEVTGQHATYSRVFSPEVRAVADRRGIEEHRVVAQIGRPAMLSSPVAWIGNALTHYTGLWSRAFVTPATLNEFQSYIDETERNELFETESRSFTSRSVLYGSRSLGIRSPVCFGHRLGDSCRFAAVVWRCGSVFARCALTADWLSQPLAHGLSTHICCLSVCSG